MMPESALVQAGATGANRPAIKCSLWALDEWRARAIGPNGKARRVSPAPKLNEWHTIVMDDCAGGIDGHFGSFVGLFYRYRGKW